MHQTRDSADPVATLCFAHPSSDRALLNESANRLRPMCRLRPQHALSTTLKELVRFRELSLISASPNPSVGIQSAMTESMTLIGTKCACRRHTHCGRRHVAPAYFHRLYLDRTDDRSCNHRDPRRHRDPGLSGLSDPRPGYRGLQPRFRGEGKRLGLRLESRDVSGQQPDCRNGHARFDHGKVRFKRKCGRGHHQGVFSSTGCQHQNQWSGSLPRALSCHPGRQHQLDLHIQHAFNQVPADTLSPLSSVEHMTPTAQNKLPKYVTTCPIKTVSRQ